MYELICEQAKELSAKYSSRERIDLLFYVTRTFASIVQKDEIDSNDLKSLGWRSVSCVNARQAIVLFVSRDCPKFLHAPFLK